MNASVEQEVHKTSISAGDVILHNGRERTVCRKDITHCEFFGVKLFGDSYRLGSQLVRKLVYIDPMKAVSL